jgi:hypothetical protein
MRHQHIHLYVFARMSLYKHEKLLLLCIYICTQVHEMSCAPKYINAKHDLVYPELS